MFPHLYKTGGIINNIKNKPNEALRRVKKAKRLWKA